MALIADKEFRYGGKMLAAGDPFEAANPRDARVLKAIGKASDAPLKTGDDLQREAATETLRGEYHTVAGADPDRRWGAERLRSEIDKAKAGGSYQRRDMRAGD